MTGNSNYGLPDPAGGALPKRSMLERLLGGVKMGASFGPFDVGIGRSDSRMEEIMQRAMDLIERNQKRQGGEQVPMLGRTMIDTPLSDPMGPGLRMNRSAVLGSMAPTARLQPASAFDQFRFP